MYPKKKNHRLNRSELAVPGSRNDFFEKAAKGNSDIIFLDLEDSVTFNEKTQARKNVIEAVNDIDWKNKSLSIRVNSFNTDLIKYDIEEILKFTSHKLDLLMIPKVNTAKDISDLDNIVTRYEKKFKRKKKIGFEIIIETGLGLINIEEISLASNRNESLHFGAADFATSIGAKTTSIGGIHQNYGVLEEKNTKKRNFFLNDMWHFALFKIVLTAHSYGLRAVDCPYGNFKDKIGFESLAKSSYTMGFDGKMLIHPDQVDLANTIYSPSMEEVKEAKEILLRMDLAKKQGKGAVAFKGKLLDIVSIKQAQNIVEIEKKIKKGKKKK